MIEENIIKIIQIDDLGRVVIPIKIREKLLLKDKENLIIKSFGNTVVIYPESRKSDVLSLENLFNKNMDLKNKIIEQDIKIDNLREMVINAVINKDYGLAKEEIKKLIKEVLDEKKMPSPFT